MVVARDEILLLLKNKGYLVDAIDYSEELIKKATQLIGIPIKLQSFYELDADQAYDGVWACASLLYCECECLADAILRLLKVLKVNGVLYMSFKYGDGDREKMDVHLRI